MIDACGDHQGDHHGNDQSGRDQDHRGRTYCRRYANGVHREPDRSMASSGSRICDTAAERPRETAKETIKKAAAKLQAKKESRLTTEIGLLPVSDSAPTGNYYRQA